MHPPQRPGEGALKKKMPIESNLGGGGGGTPKWEGEGALGTDTVLWVFVPSQGQDSVSLWFGFSQKVGAVSDNPSALLSGVL